MSAQPKDTRPPVEMVELEIDGRAVQAAKGSTIIQAVDAAKIPLPRFCYHEKLPIAALRTGDYGTAQAVIDGRIVPLVGLGGLKPEGEEINLFRVGETGDERAYAYAEIVDLCEFDPADVVTAEGSGQRLALIGGRPVELFDAAALLADAAGAEA